MTKWSIYLEVKGVKGVKEVKGHMKQLKNMKTYSFENVIAWQKAHQFVLLTYQVTRHFPEEEKFGLTSQFRRAAISIEANIAEGYKKISKADKLRFYNIAQGSLEECRDYHLLSRDLGYLFGNEFDLLHASIEETSKFLNSYCKAISDNVAMKEDPI